MESVLNLQNETYFFFANITLDLWVLTSHICEKKSSKYCINEEIKAFKFRVH